MVIYISVLNLRVVYEINTRNPNVNWKAKR